MERGLEVFLPWQQMCTWFWNMYVIGLVSYFNINYECDIKFNFECKYVIWMATFMSFNPFHFFVECD